ncbi:MAG TPA: hypothetical protein VF026_02780 [Ktedonobacteraceae bacterium]
MPGGYEDITKMGCTLTAPSHSLPAVKDRWQMQALRMPASTAKTTFFPAKRLLRASRQLKGAAEL